MNKSLSRKDNHRKSLLRNLATSLILYEEIKTTQAKAKEIKPIVEHLIQIAIKSFKEKSQKNNIDINVRRRLLGYLFDKNAVRKIFEVLVPRYKKSPSGFIKMYKFGYRLGDSSSMVILKLKEDDQTKEILKNDIKEKNGKAKKTSKKVSRKISNNKSSK